MKREYDLKLEETGYNVNPRTREKKLHSTSGVEFWFYLRVAGQVGYAVAVPLVLGAIIGKSIDLKFGSVPKGTIWGIFIGLFVSFVSFAKIIKEIIQKRD